MRPYRSNCSDLLRIGFASAVILAGASAAGAEVTSRPCPYDCDTVGIERTQCKDWREGSTCFVEDLRPRAASGRLSDTVEDPNLRREVSMVNKLIRNGDDIEVELDDDPIRRIDVVARREQGSTETTLSASLEGSQNLGGPQQVDSNQNHVIRFDVPVPDPDDDLELRANGGDVFVESVHVLYERE